MANEKEIEGDEDGARGGKGKVILIIVVALVLLLAGAAAGVFLFRGGEMAENAEQTKVEEAAPKVEQVEPTYVEMKPVFVVNLPDGGPAKMLQLGLSVSTRNPTVKDFIANNDPMLRHYIIDLLEQQPSQALLTLEGKKELQSAIRDLLSAKLRENNQPGEIKGVYFTQFVLQ